MARGQSSLGGYCTSVIFLFLSFPCNFLTFSFSFSFHREFQWRRFSSSFWSSNKRGETPDCHLVKDVLTRVAWQEQQEQQETITSLFIKRKEDEKRVWNGLGLYTSFNGGVMMMMATFSCPARCIQIHPESFFLFFLFPPTFFVAFRYDKRRREGRPFSIHFFWFK